MTKIPQPLNLIREFIKLEAAAGILLFIAALLALIVDNSPAHLMYEALFSHPLSLTILNHAYVISFTFIINEGLMSVFFLLVGLEIKREMLTGELNSRKKISLPALAALGGMVVPALIFIVCNYYQPAALRGWAIPTATDIAFALGVLSLLGRRIPIALKAFLLALAIFDDIGAIIIIAIFYTARVALLPLLLAMCVCGVLALLQRYRVQRLTPYLLAGLLLWFCCLQAGIEAAIAGVILAAFIPLRSTGASESAPLIRLEQTLHPWVAYGILPVFAFANAGVYLLGMTTPMLFNPVTLGIIAGLFVGKQLGVMGSAALAVRCNIAQKPAVTDWWLLYGAALLCGIGFTMSLFIGGLAFGETQNAFTVNVRLGVLTGSLLSGVAGYCLLRGLTARKT